MGAALFRLGSFGGIGEGYLGFWFRRSGRLGGIGRAIYRVGWVDGISISGLAFRGYSTIWLYLSAGSSLRIGCFF